MKKNRLRFGFSNFTLKNYRVLETFFWKKTAVYQFVYLFFICGCSDSDGIIEKPTDVLQLSLEEYVSIAYDSPKEINEEQVISIIKDFESDGKKTSSTIPKIVKKYYWDSMMLNDTIINNHKFPIYEVSLSNKDGKEGFALVSCDERFPCVIAYSQYGNLKDTIENVGIRMMIDEARLALEKDYYKYETIKTFYRKKALNKVKQFFGANVCFEDVKDKIILPDIATRATGEKNPSTGTLVEEGGQKIPVTWGQESPYNDLLGVQENNIKNLVGCAGVATAEIIAYYEALSSVYGYLLDWHQIKANKQIFDDDGALKIQVSNLFKHVCLGIKTTWDSNGNGSSDIKKVYSYLNSIGITFDVGSNYGGYSMDATRIVASLMEDYPVIVTGFKASSTRSSGSGGGHCWILDAYQIRTRPATSITMIQTNDTYIHANFGWRGVYDAFFLVDRGTTNLEFDLRSQGLYNQDLRIYTNVRRK